jgi:hypothetical protein
VSGVRGSREFSLLLIGLPTRTTTLTLLSGRSTPLDSLGQSGGIDDDDLSPAGPDAFRGRKLTENPRNNLTRGAQMRGDSCCVILTIPSFEARRIRKLARRRSRLYEWTPSSSDINLKTTLENA